MFIFIRFPLIFIIFYNRVILIWYHSLTSIREQVIILYDLRFFDSDSRLPSSYFLFPLDFSNSTQ